MNKPENLLKYENYREQFTRLKRALNNGFNLEAMFIEYAIMEDRTEAILRHGDKWEAYLKSRKGHNPTIDSKIRYIQKLAEENKTLINHYFSDALLSDILVWKENRNRIIHALLKQNLTTDELVGLAECGNKLARTLTDRSGNYHRAMERKRKEGIS